MNDNTREAAERAAFEHWFSDEGESPKAVERSGGSYVLMQAESAWNVWLARSALSSPMDAQAIQWPKEKSVKRRDDMSPSDAMQVGIDESGDLQVSLWIEKRGYSSVEFCSGSGGGGRSPNTRRALIALMVAMEADNEASPIKTAPPVPVTAEKKQ